MSGWVRTAAYAACLWGLWLLVSTWPFLWEIGLLGAVGGAYLCFFHRFGPAEAESGQS